jgi:NADP-dependent 3-hydroxy acid dehydrogenase YdfG
MNVLDKFRLDDKVVIGTGASAGLGVAFAEACSQAGADVVLAARRVQKLSQTAELVKSAGRMAFTFATDVTEPEPCQAIVDAAVAEYGHVDVLVNNAGVGSRFRPLVRLLRNSARLSTSICMAPTGRPRRARGS